MSDLLVPKSLNLQGNVSANWRRWRQQFELYLVASEKNKKPERLQCALFLHVAGEEAQEVYNTFTIPAADVDRLEVLYNRFEQYCTPLKNVTFERHVFNLRYQKENEPFEVFLKDLKLLVRNCEYDALQDSIIKDRIVAGIISDETRSRLLRETNLTLDRATEICRIAETTGAQMKLFIAEEKSKDVWAIKNRYTSSKQGTTNEYRRDERKKWQPKPSTTECHRCGYNPNHKQCPAWGKTCAKCNKQNHFASKCRFTGQVNSVNATGEPQEEEDFYIDNVTNAVHKQNEWSVNLVIAGQRHLHAKLDTGAQCNVLSEKCYRQLRKQKLTNSKAKLISYTNSLA